MKSDNLKTLAGILVIAIVVIATFLYGNAQRQDQLRNEQDKTQQQAKASASPTPTQDSAGVTSAKGNITNTAPVTTPAASSLQGNGLSTSSPAPAVTPSGTISAVVANNAASGSTDTPGTPVATTIPDTGSAVLPLVGIIAILTAILYVRQSRRNLLAAVRAKR